MYRNAASAGDPYTHAKVRNNKCNHRSRARLFAPSFAKPQELLSLSGRPFFLVMRRPARVIILARSMILYPDSPSVCRHPSPTVHASVASRLLPGNTVSSRLRHAGRCLVLTHGGTPISANCMPPPMTSSSPPSSSSHLCAGHMHARLAAHCHGLDLVHEQRAVISSSMHDPH